ncbi:MAG: PilZ domain-containing protein [Kofleriaceae bacterium]
MAAAEREFPRYVTEAAVVARRAGRIWRGTTTNLSRGGMCARFDNATPVGELCEFDLTLVFDESTHSRSSPSPVGWCGARRSTPSTRQASRSSGSPAITSSTSSCSSATSTTRASARDATPSVNDDVFGG